VCWEGELHCSTSRIPRGGNFVFYLSSQRFSEWCAEKFFKAKVTTLRSGAPFPEIFRDFQRVFSEAKFENKGFACFFCWLNVG
jgi:hypothetical protein